MNVGETLPSVCSEIRLIVSPDGIEVSHMRAEEILRMQEEEEEDHLAVALPALKAADTVCYVCNIVVLTVMQACTLASASWQCVVWCLGVTLQ
jgi:hypothetical protein